MTDINDIFVINWTEVVSLRNKKHKSLFTTSGLFQKSKPHNNITQSRISKVDNTDIETNTENITIEIQPIQIGTN